MSNDQGKLNEQKAKLHELPDVEVLGEWDHGMCDPDEDDIEGKKVDINSSCREIMDRAACGERARAVMNAVVNAERAVEGAIRSAIHSAASLEENMAHNSRGSQDEAFNNDAPVDTNPDKIE